MNYILSIFAINSSELNAIRWLIKSYLWAHYKRFLVIWLMGIVVIVSSGTVILMVKPALQAAFNEHEVMPLSSIALIVMAASLVAGLAEYIKTIYLEKTGLDIVSEVRLDLFAHLLDLDVDYLSRNHVGELSAVCVEETTLIRDVVGNLFVNYVQDILTFIVLFGIVLYQDWQLSLVAIIAIPILALAKGRLSKRRNTLMSMLLETRAKMTARVSETLFNVRLVKIFGAEKMESDRMYQAFNAQQKMNLESLRVRSLTIPINEVTTGMCIVLVMIVGAWRAEAGSLTLATLASIMIALISAYRPLKRLDGLVVNMREGMAAAQRIKDILDLKSNVVDHSDANKICIKKGEIRFEDVSFKYFNCSNTLKNLSFVIPPGSTFALVGPSGSGKSTLVNLIPRFFDPSYGRILIDGVDIRTVTQNSLRRCIAMITQETLLFDDTVANNIGYGSANASREQIIAAAKLASADEFITNLPNGYDSLIGARGVKLSGGERQRLSIARSLVKDAKILILDEATSSLDNLSEQMIKKAIEQLPNKPTRIIVAHRLSTIINSDIIAVVDQGEIVEFGTHETLLKNNCLYARLYESEEIYT